MRPKHPKLLMLLAGLVSSAALHGQEPVVYTDSFDYPNGSEAGAYSIPWEIKLTHSRITGVQSGKLVLNQGGKRVLLFAPVHTGPAEVSVEIDAAAKNKKVPGSSRFHLMASIDGGDWEKLQSIEGSFSQLVQASFSTSENFQLRIVSNGGSYAQTLTLDDFKVTINAQNPDVVSIAEPVWIENFEGLKYKATVDTGETAWEEFSERHSYSGIVRDRFHLAPRRAVATWETEEIDISQFSSVAVNAQVAYKKRVNSSLEASVDGGDWIPLWSDQVKLLNYTNFPTLVGSISGETLKLRFVADKWTTIQLYSVDVHGLGTPEQTEPDPVEPTRGALAQFSAVENVSNTWHLDASTSGAISYTWFLEGVPVSTDASFDLPLPPFPVELALEVVDEEGLSARVSHILNLEEVLETDLQILEDTTILSWPTSAFGFSQIEIADETGIFSTVGEPIAGTGFGAHFVSSLPYEIRISEELMFGGFDYSGENLNHLDMGGTSAPNANFASVQGRLVYLDNSDLSASNWEDATLTFAELHDADMSGARLVNSSFIDCVFDRANLSGANLTGANLQNSDFRQADLSNANFANANLSNADLRGANLDGTNLVGANLTNALRD